MVLLGDTDIIEVEIEAKNVIWESTVELVRNESSPPIVRAEIDPE